MTLPDYTMTEAKWLACAHPYGPLEFVKRRASDRQRRLFVCACCRRIWSLIHEQLFRDAVDVAEQYADRLIIGKVRKSLSKRLNVAYKASGGQPIANRNAAYAALMCLNKNIAWHPDGHLHAVWAVSSNASESERTAVEAVEYAAQTDFLRDIFGPLPFRRVITSPCGVPAAVVALANRMYESRDFSTMPILADALQDAGCANGEVLDHCREPGQHVRGCWVVDLLAGKERSNDRG